MGLSKSAENCRIIVSTHCPSAPFQIYAHRKLDPSISFLLIAWKRGGLLPSGCLPLSGILKKAALLLGISPFSYDSCLYW
jgi:hypothetical protein